MSPSGCYSVQGCSIRVVNEFRINPENLRMIIVVTGVPLSFARGVLSLYDRNMEILRYKPKGYWPLSGTDYSDLSGYSTAVTFENGAVPAKGVALTGNVQSSQTLNNTTIAYFNANPIRPGREIFPFSLAATVYPVANAQGTEQQIVSTYGTLDGITMKGTTVYFTTKYSDGSNARCSYDLKGYRRAVVLGVHTANKNSLYVNGVLVDEADVTGISYITNANNNGSLYGGYGGVAMINEVAVFESGLSYEAARRIYLDQNSGSEADVPSIYGGERIKLDESFRRPDLVFDWSDARDWDDALQLNCITSEDTLLPQYDQDGLSKQAQWLTSTVMYTGSDTITVREVNVSYDGLGATVAISFDGLVWDEINGTKSYNFNAYRKDLYVKVDFAAGKVDSYLDNLHIAAFGSNTATSIGGKVVTYLEPTTVLQPNDPKNLSDDWGVEIKAGGSVTVSNPSAVLGTYEVWFKPTVDVKNWAAFNFGNATHFINGAVVGETLLSAGVWYLLHVVPNANYSGTPLSFAAPGTYGQMALFRTALTAAQIANVYSVYTGRIENTISDTVSLTVTEPASSVLIYANDYQILSSS